jgi:hypothetical protein
MNQHLGPNIYQLRKHLNLGQEMFGCLLGCTAIAISRYERDLHPVPSHTLLRLGLLAKQAGVVDCWCFWEEAGLTRSDARAALSSQCSSSRRSALTIIDDAR